MARVLAFAYHSVGCACLKALLQTGDTIAGVITHHDSAQENIWFDSVAQLAREHSLPLIFTEDLSRRDLLDRVSQLAPDIVYSFYFRDVLTEEILRIPRLGAFNVHGSLLPRYRGRCPVNWVIINREPETGMTLHKMVKKPDAGDIIAQKSVAIRPRDTARSLFEKLVPEAAALVAENHPLIRTERAPSAPQDPAKATVFPGRRPSDGAIDWTRNAGDIDALVRAVTRPYPGAFSFLNGRKVLIWETLPEETQRDSRPGDIETAGTCSVAAGEGSLRILSAEGENGEDLVRDGIVISGALARGDVFESRIIQPNKERRTVRCGSFSSATVICRKEPKE